MNFELLEDATGRFTAAVNGALGREAIKLMTLEAPVPPTDELYFHRLVVWCYGFFFEAAADVLKDFKALLKQGPPERTNRFDRGTKLVNNLRTYKVHNLPPSKENDYKRRQAEAWIADAKSNGQGVSGASQELCRIGLEMVNDLISVWTDATVDAYDSAQLVERMLMSLDGTWQPHEVDSIVRDVAIEINLSGFDAKAFRDQNLEAWRRGASCFIDREAATAGLRRLIRSTMQNSYGAS